LGRLDVVGGPSGDEGGTEGVDKGTDGENWEGVLYWEMNKLF
jgi:hypothetical protein